MARAVEGVEKKERLGLERKKKRKKGLLGGSSAT